MSPLQYATQTRALEARVACIQARIPDHGLGRIEAEAALDHYMGDLMLRLKAYVYGERLGTATVRYPRDWLEAVKERFAPPWLKSRWPVMYTSVDIRSFACYPEFRPANGLGPVVRIHELVRHE